MPHNKPPQPSTPLDDEVEQIIDDTITAIGYWVMHLSNEEAKSKAIKENRPKLDKAYAKQFLELPEMQDETQGDVHFDDGVTDFVNVVRNKLRADLRAAVNKMLGAQDE